MNQDLSFSLPKSFKKKGVAFVSSTLPASLLVKQLQSGAIQKIYVSSVKFIASYEFLVKKTGKDIQVTVLTERTRFGGLLDCIKKIKDIKQKNLHIYIYHECCWPSLDLSILIVKPKGIFAPQSKIEFMFKPISSLKYFFHKCKFSVAVKHCFLSVFFKYYYSTNNDLDGDLIVPVVRYYPKSILKLNDIKLTKNSSNTINPKDSEMLILVGSDCASSKELISLYNCIIDRALDKGFKVSIKDHPNEDARLNLERHDVQVIHPKIPCELIEDSFSIIIGTASAAMIGFGSRSISVINLLESMSDLDKTQRINYIRSLNELVKFPASVDEILQG